MPLYEYECEACGHRFEQIRKFSDAPLELCPACGRGPVRKLMSSPAIQFKGTGWYITDYARKESGPASRTDGAKTEGAGGKPGDGDKPSGDATTAAAGSGDSRKGEAKAESKADAKTENKPSTS